MKLFRTQLELDVTKGLLSGVARGAVAGGVASVATGAALVSLPAGPGAIVVCVATAARWAAVGSVLGGIAGGAGAWIKHRRIDREFAAAFQSVPAA